MLTLLPATEEAVLTTVRERAMTGRDSTSARNALTAAVGRRGGVPHCPDHGLLHSGSSITHP